MGPHLVDQTDRGNNKFTFSNLLYLPSVPLYRHHHHYRVRTTAEDDISAATHSATRSAISQHETQITQGTITQRTTARVAKSATPTASATRGQQRSKSHWTSERAILKETKWSPHSNGRISPKRTSIQSSVFLMMVSNNDVTQRIITPAAMVIGKQRLVGLSPS